VSDKPKRDVERMLAARKPPQPYAPPIVEPELAVDEQRADDDHDHDPRD
jgi:hypothetical protein